MNFKWLLIYDNLHLMHSVFGGCPSVPFSRMRYLRFVHLGDELIGSLGVRRSWSFVGPCECDICGNSRRDFFLDLPQTFTWTLVWTDWTRFYYFVKLLTLCIWNVLGGKCDSIWHTQGHRSGPLWPHRTCSASWNIWGLNLDLKLNYGRGQRSSYFPRHKTHFWPKLSNIFLKV